MSVVEPLPSPDDPAWNVTIEREDSGQTEVTIQKPTQMALKGTPEAAQEGAPFSVIPAFKMLDSAVSKLCLCSE